MSKNFAERIKQQQLTKKLTDDLTNDINALTTDNIAEGSNLYYTAARARAAISLTATGLTYVDGVIGLDANYKILTNAEYTGLSGASHSHSNKTLLDTYDQSNTDIADAVNKKHAHSNLSNLDSIDQDLGATDSPTFAVVTVTAGYNGDIVILDGDGVTVHTITVSNGIITGFSSV